MPALGLVKRSIVGTGIDEGPGSKTVICEAHKVSLVKDTVSAHGAPPHNKAIIANGSKSVLADGEPVVVQTISKARCGHPVNSGAISVIVGD